MTLGLIWRETALDDLDAIAEYIGLRDMGVAERLVATLEACAERLTEHPYLYRPGRVPGMREAVAHPNYVLIYRVGAETVEIVNVIHTRRQYPPQP